MPQYAMPQYKAPQYAAPPPQFAPPPLQPMQQQQQHSPRSQRAPKAAIDPSCLQNFITCQPVVLEGNASLSIPLPDRLISGIIGKGGSQIKEIKSRSAATVLISQKDELTASGERTVTVSGTTDAVNNAKVSGCVVGESAATTSC